MPGFLEFKLIFAGFLYVQKEIKKESKKESNGCVCLFQWNMLDTMYLYDD